MVISAETIQSSTIGPFSGYAGTSVPGKSDQNKLPHPTCVELFTLSLCGIKPTLTTWHVLHAIMLHPTQMITAIPAHIHNPKAIHTI